MTQIPELIASKNGALIRQNLAEVEARMLQEPQVECQVFHHFGPGVYIREVHIPAGTFSVGHHQKFDHMNVMLKGRVTMLNDDGTTSELQAPFVYVSKPGRKIGYIHEDMVWQNIYATPETDIETLEAHFIDKSEQWQENADMHMAVQRLQREPDREDYRAMLIETGFTEEIARHQSEAQHDRIDVLIPKVKLAESPIEGKGLFATANIAAGEFIAMARIGNNRTQAGRYTNHAQHPNARMISIESGDIALIALVDIAGCHGGQDGEEITVDYRVALHVAQEMNLCLR